MKILQRQMLILFRTPTTICSDCNALWHQTVLSVVVDVGVWLNRISKQNNDADDLTSVLSDGVLETLVKSNMRKMREERKQQGRHISNTLLLCASFSAYVQYYILCDVVGTCTIPKQLLAMVTLKRFQQLRSQFLAQQQIHSDNKCTRQNSR